MSTPNSRSHLGRPSVVASAAIFFVLLVAYLSNGDVLPGNDAKPNVYLALSAIHDHDLTFTPWEVPFMFAWTLSRGHEKLTVYPRSWDQRHEGRTFAEWRDSGQLEPASGKYYIVPSRQPGRYVSMYGPGTGLTAAPVFAVAELALGDLSTRPEALWHTAKVTASVLVAGSAVFLFLALLTYIAPGRAALLALTYGLGTCVWSSSSQALWQHGPNVFFLSLATFLFLRPQAGTGSVAGAGLAYALATACRPNSALVLAAVGAYLLWSNRKQLVPFAVGAAGPVLLLAAYNLEHHGSPLRFGQTLRGAAEAEAITGAPGAWQTPLLEGLAGHLVSPSRGLVVFSPFLLLALWGVVRIWRDRTYTRLRPLTLAVVAILLVSSKWYYWWGGWSFGYRLIVDITLLLALFVAPVLDTVFRRRWILAISVVLIAWSVGVQVLGAFAYNLRDWNARVAGYAVQVPGTSDPEIVADLDIADRLIEKSGGRVVGVVRLDVNSPEHRHRLWSWRDQQIGYYLRNFAESRRAKREMMQRWFVDPGI